MVLGVLLIALYYLIFNIPIPVYIICMLDSMYETMSISTGLSPILDLWNTNKLQLQEAWDLMQKWTG